MRKREWATARAAARGGRPSTVGRAAATIAAIAAVALPAAARAQSVPEVAISSGVAPAEVTVGEIFRVRLRVDAPADVVVEFAERPPATASVEPSGPVTVRPGDPGEPYVADYPLVAWTTGELERPVVPVFVRDVAGAEYVVRVQLPVPAVRSVLPVADDLPEPRPARGVLEASQRWGWWLLLGLLAMVALALAWLAARRRARVEPAAMAATIPPRQRALQRLDEARRLGLVDAGEWKAFYSRVSDALRGYLAALEPGWGAELTTAELVAAAQADGLPSEQVTRLAALLERADRVKFARVRPGRTDAEHDWTVARRLIEEVEPIAADAAPAAAEVAA